ncbi:MAG TPA: sigma-54 dependent transcriptional regulator [Vicinamibacterales bacterium]|nr:sigma-54 dependent transcriptional regulator [Vicinamibacterales bacterium]
MTPAKLALVDDDQQFVQYLDTLLRARGYDVHPFTSGSDLLQAMHAEAPPDVVLLDVSMPGMDGLETLKAVRVAHPNVQVIMLSGRQAPATIVDAMRQGAADYVVKPDDPDGVGEAALESAIRNAVEKTVLTSEVARLRTQIGDDPDSVTYWGPGPGMRQVLSMVDRVADSDVSVLLRGESGVGKEVVARELHRKSPRRAKPFVKVNAAALPSELLESELFGHERGAFTGAQNVRIGKFEFANHGTLMLDEIAEMPPGLQVKLLHVLQDSEFTKLGSNKPVSIDVRIIAATNRDLEAMMRAGSFREDLYYRLQVIEIFIPPLRERRDEINQFIEFFLVKYSERYGRPLRKPSDALRDALLKYGWPGNVRELENVIKRFVILQDESLVLAELKRARAVAADAAAAPPLPVPQTPISSAAAAIPPPMHTPPPAPVPAPAPPPAVAVPVAEAPGSNGNGEEDIVAEAAGAAGSVSLPELAREAAMKAERAAIQQALDRFRWNRRKAADFLGVSYKTLLNKMKECGISEQVQ